MNDLTRTPFAKQRNYPVFTVPYLTKKDVIVNTSTLDILCASNEEEFYYEGNGEPVPEGETVGIDVNSGEGVELVLFSNIYWQPNYE
jgi:hypothetical protein